MHIFRSSLNVYDEVEVSEPIKNYVFVSHMKNSFYAFGGYVLCTRLRRLDRMDEVAVTGH